jgi:hypothetical protein
VHEDGYKVELLANGEARFYHFLGFEIPQAPRPPRLSAAPRRRQRAAEDEEEWAVVVPPERTDPELEAMFNEFMWPTATEARPPDVSAETYPSTTIAVAAET